MTKEEFKALVESKRAEYMQATEDYLDALIEGDFNKALKKSLIAPDILGIEAMAYIAKEVQNLESYDEIMESYEEKCMEVTHLVMDE
jgi:hypothetical protein